MNWIAAIAAGFYASWISNGKHREAPPGFIYFLVPAVAIVFSPLLLLYLFLTRH